MKDIYSQSKLLLAICLGIVITSCTRKAMPPNLKESTALLRLDSVRLVTIDQGPRIIGPCEPSISVNPTNTLNMVAGSVLDRHYHSFDGGKTWTNGRLTSMLGVYGDPVVKHTKTGRALYGHLSNPAGKAYTSPEFLDRIVVQVSDDGGVTWQEGSFPRADRTKDHDKHWIGVDPVSGDILMSWTEFDKYGSSDSSDRSRILFSVSRDNGDSWSDAVVVSEFEGDCLDDDKTTEGAVPAAGIDGTFYIVWSFDSKIYLDRSFDKGRTWQDKDKIIAVQPGGWSISIPGIDRCNGMPVLKADHSPGKYRGNLYVSWSDQRNGEVDTDIWCMTSADSGETWSAPVRVNDDPPGRHQFMSWMDVDPVSGVLWFVFYDRRAHQDEQTDVYLAYSTDGGKTFVNKKISEKPFLPQPVLFFGDYNDISAYNGVIRPIWTEQEGKTLRVRTALVNVKK